MLVGLEDQATASVVATAAAHLAMEQDASALLVLHVLDTYSVVGALLDLSGGTGPALDTGEEQEALLALAEAALRAEYGARDRPVPVITRMVRAGAPAAVIAQVAEDVGAAMIVVGARRPHVFGRRVHSDVRAALTAGTTAPVHVVSLQAQTPG